MEGEDAPLVEAYKLMEENEVRRLPVVNRQRELIGIITRRVAAALGVSRQTIHELLREERSVTPLMALRLARLFGNSATFWLNAQQALDLWQSEQSHQDELFRIQPLPAEA